MNFQSIVMLALAIVCTANPVPTPEQQTNDQAPRCCNGVVR